MSILDLYNQLSDNDKSALNVAFEQGTAHLVVLSEDRFIGVYIEEKSTLDIVEEANNWYIGRIL